MIRIMIPSIIRNPSWLNRIERVQERHQGVVGCEHSVVGLIKRAITIAEIIGGIEGIPVKPALISAGEIVLGRQAGLIIPIGNMVH